jgi:hypothetical protein
MNPPLQALIIILLSLFIGAFGRNYRFGFWGYIFSSLLLTPLVGILLVIASKPKETAKVYKYKVKKGKKE